MRGIVQEKKNNKYLCPNTPFRTKTKKQKKQKKRKKKKQNKTKGNRKWTSKHYSHTLASPSKHTLNILPFSLS